MANKPAIPKGTRDFGPKTMARRNYIFNSIKKVFELHGFNPIETPAMELRETLLGKYGDEGDKLIFNIAPRGEKFKKIVDSIKEITNVGGQEPNNPALYDWLLSNFADEALRYDLTVPFARFVVQNRNEIQFPFKRYQIQPVWRADRPQKGRYREFYQCDVDIIGSDSLSNEVDLICIVDEVFTRLNLPEISIKINNRKVLEGIAEVIGASAQLTSLTIALDKLDKMPVEAVEEELLRNGIAQEAVEKLRPLLALKGENAHKMEFLTSFLVDSQIGQKGLAEVQYVLDHAETLKINSLVFDVTLARGLSYYTGAIFEVVHPALNSSITGGGRYDDLTGIFGLPNLSGVGISFGADRIYDVLEAENKFPESVEQSAKVLFANFDEALLEIAQLLRELRKADVACELYPDAAKLKKQFKYAEDKSIPFLAILGNDELARNEVQLKNIQTGEQQSLSIKDLISYLS